MKWLALSAALVAAAWWLLRESGSVAPATAVVTPAAARTASPAPPPSLPAARDELYLPAGPAPGPPSPPPPPEDESGLPQVRLYSDEFWERIDEVYTRRLLGHAATCDPTGTDRKQKLSLAFRFSIRGGEVSVDGVRVVESTLSDPTLERCLVDAIARARFEDRRMPDWHSQAGDEETLLVRVGGLKRFGLSR